MPRRSLPDLDREEVALLLAGWNEPAFRVGQIWRAVYQELVSSYDAITTLPRPLRARLAAELPLDPLQAAERLESADKTTEKVLFRLADGETIEAVLMRYDARRTVCLSTQVGCAIGCPFCATGRAGFRRDLTAGEIVSQVLHFARELRVGGERPTNVVYMGMGEPFLNYEATMKSIRLLNDPEGFGLRARGFTVSTAGIVPGIERLASEDVEVNLAVSLHAGSDRLRNALVPVNSRYLLSEVIHACRVYVARTRRRVTFEVALIEGVNDSLSQAREIARLLEGLLAHVNLIPLNPVPGSPLRPSPPGRRAAFARELRGAGIPVTLRRGRGIEIEAGCGQLRGRAAAGTAAVSR